MVIKQQYMCFKVTYKNNCQKGALGYCPLGRGGDGLKHLHIKGN
uniref:Uncharacterized protein n=1 Tax=Rhizophora mucronata TaxID=61149 RepID=A0A2P2P7H2_RHIMU